MFFHTQSNPFFGAALFRYSRSQDSLSVLFPLSSYPDFWLWFFLYQPGCLLILLFLACWFPFSPPPPRSHYVLIVWVGISFVTDQFDSLALFIWRSIEDQPICGGISFIYLSIHLSFSFLFDPSPKSSGRSFMQNPKWPKNDILNLISHVVLQIRNNLLDQRIDPNCGDSPVVQWPHLIIPDQTNEVAVNLWHPVVITRGCEIRFTCSSNPLLSGPFNSKWFVVLCSAKTLP